MLFACFQAPSQAISHRKLVLANGAIQKNLTGTALRGLKIFLPSLEEQQKIVGIFRACDAKIAALEREKALLEELFECFLEEPTTGRLSTLPLLEEGETHE